TIDAKFTLTPFPSEGLEAIRCSACRSETKEEASARLRLRLTGLLEPMPEDIRGGTHRIGAHA
ncbi:MAG: hypothetical protein RR969_10060, partial [Thermomonas sp.]